jgi:hypothetical protein
MMRLTGIVLTLIYLMIAQPCFAQSNFYEEDPKVFSGGLILGANFSQIDGDTYYGFHKIGLNTGGVVYVHFTQKIGASLEFIYSQKGSRGESVSESPSIGTYVAKYFMNVNYVEVPLTFHVIAHDLDFEAGVSYAYLIKSKEWIQADYPVIIDPVLNRFNTTDLDYVFGIGRKLYKKLYGNIRYQYSITSIRPNYRIPLDFGYGNQGQWNNLFCFRLMYFF